MLGDIDGLKLGEATSAPPLGLALGEGLILGDKLGL